MMETPTPVHATAVAVAVDPDGPLVGALIMGPSGAGKSALALSLIESCFWRRTALVADDAVLLRAEKRGVVAMSPSRIEGLIEVRGFGPAPCRSVARAKVVAVFDLVGRSERLPEARIREFFPGVSLPAWPFQVEGVDAPARLRLTLRAILSGQM